MIAVRATALAGFVVLSACSSDKPAAPAPSPVAGSAAQLIGIYPDEWTCDQVATIAQVGTALGGEVRQLDGVMQTPAGVPRPCNYALGGGDAAVEAWTFDIDCRDQYEKLANGLFAEYQRGSEDLVAAYNGASDAGPLPTVDGGPPIKAPEAAHPVEVGKRGLDHHGQGILFIDDDAPCYVRVVGPDAARRLALAKLVAHGLTRARAPMTPRLGP
jgi:hypothetical protein